MVLVTISTAQRPDSHDAVVCAETSIPATGEKGPPSGGGGAGEVVGEVVGGDGVTVVEGWADVGGCGGVGGVVVGTVVVGGMVVGLGPPEIVTSLQA